MFIWSGMCSVCQNTMHFLLLLFSLILVKKHRFKFALPNIHFASIFFFRIFIQAKFVLRLTKIKQFRVEVKNEKPH